MLVIAYFIWPSRFGGDTTYAVVKGISMQPDYVTGDIVIARPKDAYEVGDVVVYAVPDDDVGAGKLVVHRLIAFEPDGSYVIQGDNRDEPDAFDVGYDDVLGAQILHVPHIALVTRVVGRWWVIGALAGMFVLAQLWPSTDASDEESETEPETEPEPDLEPTAGSAADEAHQVTVPFARAGVTAIATPLRAGASGSAARIIVDADSLRQVAFPDADPTVAMELCLDLCHEVAVRFGTRISVVFDMSAGGGRRDSERSRDGSERVRRAVIEEHHDLSAVIRERRALDLAGAALTTLVVSSAEHPVRIGGDEGAQVMSCEAWLAVVTTRAA